MYISSQSLIDPVTTSELLNCLVQKNGTLSIGYLRPAIFNAATEP